MVDEVSEEIETTKTVATENAPPSEAVTSTESQETEATTKVEKDEADIEAEKQKNQQHALWRKQSKQSKENRQLKAELAELKTKAAETKAPVADNYDNYDDYIKAAVDHGISQGQPKETYNPHDDYANDLTATGSAKYDDFEQKAWASAEMLPVLEEFENAADIAYYLGQNPQDAQRIQQMSNVGMAREFAKIDAKVNMPKPRTTKAPEPVKPVETTSTATTDIDKMSMSEYAAYRNKQQYG
jgi:hypothetical protein